MIFSRTPSSSPSAKPPLLLAAQDVAPPRAHLSLDPYESSRSGRPAQIYFIFPSLLFVVSIQICVGSTPEICFFSHGPWYFHLFRKMGPLPLPFCGGLFFFQLFSALSNGFPDRLQAKLTFPVLPPACGAAASGPLFHHCTSLKRPADILIDLSRLFFAVSTEFLLLNQPPT